MTRKYAVRLEANRLDSETFRQSSTFAELDHIVGLVVRDYVRPWYDSLSPDGECPTALHAFIMQALLEATRRVRRVNAKQMTEDLTSILLQHLTAVNAAVQEAMQADGTAAPQQLLAAYTRQHSHLAAGCPTREDHHCLHLATILLAALVPDREYSSRIQTCLLAKVLARKVLPLLMDLAGDPSMLCRCIANVLGPAPPGYLSAEQLLALYHIDPPEAKPGPNPEEKGIIERQEVEGAPSIVISSRPSEDQLEALANFSTAAEQLVDPAQAAAAPISPSLEALRLLPRSRYSSSGSVQATPTALLVCELLPTE